MCVVRGSAPCGCVVFPFQILNVGGHFSMGFDIDSNRDFLYTKTLESVMISALKQNSGTAIALPTAKASIYQTPDRICRWSTAIQAGSKGPDALKI